MEGCPKRILAPSEDDRQPSHGEWRVVAGGGDWTDPPLGTEWSRLGSSFGYGGGLGEEPTIYKYCLLLRRHFGEQNYSWQAAK